MKKNKDILKFISESQEQLIQERIKFDEKTAAIVAKRELMKTGLMKKMCLTPGDEVTMVFKEHRDDSVSCFQAEQTVNCFIVDVKVMDFYGEDADKEKRFLAPVLKMDMKKAKSMNYNAYLTWMLFDKKGKMILMNTPEQVIIPGKYTEEELATTREICLAAQKKK
jgi:hypothetical protein